MPSPSHPLRLGTRTSSLALRQAEMAANALRRAHGWPKEAVEIVPIKTPGIRRGMGQDKGVFTAAIEEALRREMIDVGVHSMKDLPAAGVDDLVVDRVLRRADPHDVLVRAGGGKHTIESLPRGCRVGTAAPRRQAQLRRLRPDLKVVCLRGNVDTRLRKLDGGDVAALVLARAGLVRLRCGRGVVIPFSRMLPAAGQGVIGFQRRAGDRAVARWLLPVHHAPTGVCLAAERAFVRSLDGSCHTPIAALATFSGGGLRLRGEYLSPDGVVCVSADLVGSPARAAALGCRAGGIVLKGLGRGGVGGRASGPSPRES